MKKSWALRPRMEIARIGLGFREGLGFGVYGLGFGMLGVEGLGLKACNLVTYWGASRE